MRLDLHEVVDRIRRQTELEPFSGVVLLTEGDEVLFGEGYGLANRSERIPNTVNTRFQMASGSKIFTAVAICQLAQRGELRFDSLLNECVDVVFPEYAPDISIRHLLTHSSGITSYYEQNVDPDYETVWQNLPTCSVREPRDFLPLFQHKPMKFSPGERFDYNDGGYILLGLVIECVTSMSFSEYVERNVFKRAGMNDSGYFATDQLPERSAHAYIRNKDGTWRTNVLAVPIVGAPDGGAYTTAPDMAAFWKALIGRRLLNAELSAWLLEPHIATSQKSPYTHYGYGVWIESQGEAVRRYFVEGLDPGVAMRSSVYVDRDLALTMIGNTSGALWPLAREIERALIP